MFAPPSSYLRVESCYQRGDYAAVLAEGDAVAGELAADPAHAPLTATLALMMGVAAAAYEANDVAAAYLTFGVDRARADEPKSPPSPARPPMSAPTPGPYPAGYTLGQSGVTRSTAITGATAATPVTRPPKGRPSFADHGELLLVELDLLAGRVGSARDRLPRLLEPHRAVTTRFAATRAQSILASHAGEHETAHHHANTAAGLAARVPSRLRLALVDGDRATILARQGRGYEAINIADRILGQLVRPVVGPDQLWSSTEGVVLALTLSRAAALGGDHLASERLLQVGESIAPSLHRHLIDGQVNLARATLAIEQRRFDEAEATLHAASSTFHDHGYRPLAALTVAEQGRLAHHLDLYTSSRPLYEAALDELLAVGMQPEAHEVLRLIAAVDAGDPPPRPASLAPATFKPGSRPPNVLPPSSVPRL